MEKTKIWKVQNDKLIELKSENLDYEERIHRWIEEDISIILPNTILIGSKVKTDHGKEVDLMAIDENGDLIIIELKRGLTSREVTAQALDYASWADGLNEEDIDLILKKNGKDKSIAELLSEKFENAENIDINENQKIFIVASSVDSITERICKYLANNGLQINVLTFNYYRDGDKEFISRNFLVNEKYKTKKSLKKKNGRYVTSLFNEGKLRIGQKLKYLPLENLGIHKTATIFREGSKCIKLDETHEEFSFSGLRKKLILENNIDLNPHFPYMQWVEWELIDEGIKLSDL
ncbi:MAG: hypothetical protein N4A49_09240 [Marinifilaceae bacterium]|jgi:hypothetical protein|nr:hypothetical protein [Marinifilaceae bacterium]